MKGIGIDIVSIARFKRIRYLNRFLELVFLPQEMVELKNKKGRFSHISSRFAAKEAIIKAVPEQITTRDFMVTKDGLKPKVVFLNKKFRKLKVLLSLSHCEEYSAAVAMVE